MLLTVNWWFCYEERDVLTAIGSVGLAIHAVLHGKGSAGTHACKLTIKAQLVVKGVREVWLFKDEVFDKEGND